MSRMQITVGSHKIKEMKERPVSLFQVDSSKTVDAWVKEFEQSLSFKYDLHSKHVKVVALDDNTIAVLWATGSINHFKHMFKMINGYTDLANSALYD